MDDSAPLRTFGSIAEWHKKFVEDGAKEKNAQFYKNCVRPTILKARVRNIMTKEKKNNQIKKEKKKGGGLDLWRTVLGRWKVGFILRKLVVVWLG